MIPINIELLHKNFVSHSFEARKSMNEVLLYYKVNRANLKKQIFKLNDNDDTYHEIANIIGRETRSAQVWLQNMEEIMKL